MSRKTAVSYVRHIFGHVPLPLYMEVNAADAILDAILDAVHFEEEYREIGQPYRAA